MDDAILKAALKKMSLFELFHLAEAVRHELDNAERTESVRNSFKIGDELSFWDPKINGLRNGIVFEKTLKYVSLHDKTEQFRAWKIPYCFLNLANVQINSYSTQEQLSKHNLKVGDRVGFNKDGEKINGVVTRLNYMYKFKFDLTVTPF